MVSLLGVLSRDDQAGSAMGGGVCLMQVSSTWGYVPWLAVPGKDSFFIGGEGVGLISSKILFSPTQPQGKSQALSLP